MYYVDVYVYEMMHFQSKWSKIDGSLKLCKYNIQGFGLDFELSGVEAIAVGAGGKLAYVGGSIGSNLVGITELGFYENPCEACSFCV